MPWRAMYRLLLHWGLGVLSMLPLAVQTENYDWYMNCAEMALLNRRAIVASHYMLPSRLNI